MRPFAFKVQMYRSVIDSGWIEINPMTVLVGKNESGKTTLLKALHKFNPHSPDPYSMDSEWPRGRRKDRSPTQVVCSVRFRFTDEEVEELARITDVPLDSPQIEITKDYEGRFEVYFPMNSFLIGCTPTPSTRFASRSPSCPTPWETPSVRRRKRRLRRPDVWPTRAGSATS